VAKLRMGLVGGGEGAFIGAVHRLAAELDGRIELACGAFSSDPERSRRAGKEIYGLPPQRSYGSYEEMIETEKGLAPGRRMHFVVVATPNHVHFPVAKLALENGFHVMSDKPVTFDLEEARALAKLTEETGLLFGLTHNYTGYPMIKEARRLIAEGALGEVRRVVAEYIQGWLARRIEGEGQKQAIWRTDPSKAGAAGCMGDIGIHAENLLEYVTGRRIASVCADLTTFVGGRGLDDDGNVLLRLDNGAKGVLFASQISAGEENALKLRVYGERGGLEWAQMEPNTLILRWLDAPAEIRRTGGPGMSETAARSTRLPPGHPEGFLEAFANLYANYARALEARLDDREPDSADLDFPTITEGVRGMEFIDAVVESSRRASAWVDLPH
jgi:predicted dehydrogenase